MNPEDILEHMKNLTEEIKSQKGQLTEDNLEDFLGGVSESIAQVFEIAQLEIDKSLKNIEVAKNYLIEEGLHEEAATVSPLIGNVLSVQNQLSVGREVAGEQRDFEDLSNDLETQNLLTPQILNRFASLKQALEASQRRPHGET